MGPCVDYDGPLNGHESSMAIPHTGDFFLGRYRLIKAIGGGTFSVVFRAEQLGVGREVAVKILASAGPGRSSVVEDRFVREVKLLARLRHPNTITLIDCGRTDAGEPFFVTEFVPGKTVEQLLRDEGTLSVDRTFRIIRQVLGSLREAHLTGVVHRDIKPANIMVFDRIDAREVVKVLDFGVASFLEEITEGMIRKAITPRGELLGTPRYMAPEVLAGKVATPAADIFAVGLTIYEMITGVPAIEGETPIEVLNRQFAGRPAIDPSDGRISAPLHALLRSGTDRTVEMRTPDAATFLRQLDAVAETVAATARASENRGRGHGRGRTITRMGHPNVGGVAVAPRSVRRLPRDTRPTRPPAAQDAFPALEGGQDMGVPVPSAHAKVLARALFDDPTQDVSAFSGVDELARSLLHRISGPTSHDEDHTEDLSMVDEDGTIDVLIPEPEWDPESRVDLTLDSGDDDR